jgi:hypothetical protein
MLDLHTVPLRTGFAQLRWGMSRQQARTIYPQARTTPTYEGRHPVTKERVVVGGNELIPEIQEVIAGLQINATLTFDATDELIRIELWPDLEPPLPGPRKVDMRQLRDGASCLALGLGLDSISEIPEQHEWVVDGVAVTLTSDDGFRFELSLSTPR